MKTLITIQNELRDLVPQGTDLALGALKKILKPGSDKYDDYLALEGRYQDVSRQLLQGIISMEDATLEFNKIRRSLLDFVDDLHESDVPALANLTATEGGMADIYNGEVLYRIPKKMQLGIEVECIVRLAFDRKKILDEFEVQVGDVMKDLRISDVMGVELLDPNSDKAFAITTLNDTVQFVEKDLVTEWIFCVTPLKQGQFPLILKISIIEIINGIERKRNEVLREHVEILTQKPSEAGPGFVSAGYSWQVIDTDEQRAVPGGGGQRAESPPPPNSPRPTAPSPQAPVAPKSGGFRKIATVLGAVLALVISVWAIIGNFGNQSVQQPTDIVHTDSIHVWEGVRKGGSREELEEFVIQNPGTVEALEALSMLDSIENEVWKEALASNDDEQIRKYMDEYPDGKYLEEAASRIGVVLNPKLNSVEGDTVRLAPKQEIIKIEPKKTPNNTKTKPSLPTRKTPTKPVETKKTKPGTPIPAPTEKPKRPPVDPNKPVSVKSIARQPVFRGCDDSNLSTEEKCTVDKIYKYLRNGFKYPPLALEKSIEGTVNVSFVIERDGSITEVKATNDIGGGCAAEAVRLVKKLPNFKPGLNAKGEPVRVIYNQPVRFNLE